MSALRWLAGSLLALGIGTVNPGPARAGQTLDTVKARGTLNCGVNVGVAGFSLPDSQGTWRGMDADLCRGLAAALFGDANKVRFVPLTAVQRFTALQSGEIDVLIRQTTLTMTRDTTLGLRMVIVNLYDGHGFMVRTDAGVTEPKGRDGTDADGWRDHLPLPGQADGAGDNRLVQPEQPETIPPAAGTDAGQRPC